MTTGFFLTLLVTSASAVQFSFTPSPNIEVSQTVVYQCSVNDTRVAIHWSVNQTALPHDDYTDFSITGTAQSSNLTIPGLAHYNNTIVRCIASGHLGGGVFYNNVSNSTLRIQGKLAAVKDISCEQEGDYCIQCNWSEPFSLTDIPSYIVNITTTTNREELLISDTTVDTNWRYCPSHFGNYTISVAGNNTAGQGEVRADSVNLIPTMNNITNYTIEYQRSNNGSWNMTCIIKSVTYFKPNPVTICAYLTSTEVVNSFIIHREGHGEYEGNDLVQYINLGSNLTENIKWTLNFILIYNTFSINTSTIEFSTFSVRNATWSIIDANTGSVRFSCQFVIGSNITGCIVTYKCLRSDFNGNVTILRDPLNAVNGTNVTGIYNSTYNVTAYDIDDMTNPAVELVGQSIFGLPPPVTTTPATGASTVSSVTTSAAVMTSPSLSPSTTETSVGQVMPWTVIVGVVPVVLVVLVITTVAILMCRVLIHKKKLKQKSVQSEEKGHTNIQTNNKPVESTHF